MTWLILRGPITAGVEMYNNVCILWLDTGSLNYISWCAILKSLLFLKKSLLTFKLDFTQ